MAATDFTTPFLTGIAQLLHSAGAGVWRGDGTGYLASEVGIVLGLPSPTPHRLIALAAYTNDSGDDPTTTDSLVTLQVRTRSPDTSTIAADETGDGVFDVLQGLHGYDLPTGIRVVTSKRRNSLPMGLDKSGRYERADNYDIATHRPGTNRE